MTTPKEEEITNGGEPHICNTPQVHITTDGKVWLCPKCHMGVDEPVLSKLFTKIRREAIADTLKKVNEIVNNNQRIIQEGIVNNNIAQGISAEKSRILYEIRSIDNQE